MRCDLIPFSRSKNALRFHAPRAATNNFFPRNPHTNNDYSPHFFFTLCCVRPGDTFSRVIFFRSVVLGGRFGPSVPPTGTNGRLVHVIILFRLGSRLCPRLRPQPIAYARPPKSHHPGSESLSRPRFERRVADESALVTSLRHAALGSSFRSGKPAVGSSPPLSQERGYGTVPSRRQTLLKRRRRVRRLSSRAWCAGLHGIARHRPT